MRVAIPAALFVVCLMLLGFGCARTMGDCGFRCTVIDAETKAPIDSARVYLTYVDYFQVSYGRHLGGFTDDQGRFFTLFGCDGFYLIDVEKEGYAPSRQTVHQVDDLLFALERNTGVLPRRARALGR